MRKRGRYLWIALVVLIIAGFLLAETLIVKVKTTYLRKEPLFYSQTIAALQAGQSLEKISSQGSWLKVKTSSGLVGWVHLSAVQQKKFSLLAMDKTLKTKTSADEVALAAKGFNKQVEDKYRARHKNLSYAWIERMLRFKLTPAQIKVFLKEGKLAEFGGGQ